MGISAGSIRKIAGIGFGAVMTIAMPIQTYKESRKNGSSVGVSALKAAAESVFYATPVGEALGTAQLGSEIAKMVLESGMENAKHSTQAYKSQFGGNYDLSQNGYTMRQRGMNAINKTGMYRGQVLGSEARSYHRGYFSSN